MDSQAARSTTVEDRAVRALERIAYLLDIIARDLGALALTHADSDYTSPAPPLCFKHEVEW